MPIFEYRCESCGEQIEKISSKPLDEIECPKCSKQAKRVLSVFATTNNSAPSGCGSGGCAPGGSGFR
ncbi:MAG: hypothetical protein C0624_03550 [Desulfuromonas sp.]|nr:MAG: hypothetical protein C0624_03550 [Desulfuromonas sp.]